MRKRLLVVGIGAALLGAYLLLAPISAAPVKTVDMENAHPTVIAIPSSQSLLGGSVFVEMSAGSASPQCVGFCPSRPATGPAAIDVFDCGVSDCSGAVNYSYVGTMEISSLSGADFSATPGHGYQLWVRSAINASRNISLPVNYSIHGPVLGGVAGAIVILGAGAAVVWSIRGPRHFSPSSSVQNPVL